MRWSEGGGLEGQGLCCLFFSLNTKSCVVTPIPDYTSRLRVGRKQQHTCTTDQHSISALQSPHLSTERKSQEERDM